MVTSNCLVSHLNGRLIRIMSSLEMNLNRCVTSHLIQIRLSLSSFVGVKVSCSTTNNLRWNVHVKLNWIIASLMVRSSLCLKRLIHLIAYAHYFFPGLRSDTSIYILLSRIIWGSNETIFGHANLLLGNRLWSDLLIGSWWWSVLSRRLIDTVIHTRIVSHRLVHPLMNSSFSNLHLLNDLARLLVMIL